ncbi:MAG: carbohydrate kinase family protein [bacterium]|nr:carbohydrate kinase family protein [bacterium]
MFDVITFGSATFDIFLKDKKLGNFLKKGFFQIPLGEKINLEKIEIFSGGGGMNTAITFAKRNLKTAYCGSVGNDVLGGEIIKELKEKKVDCRFVKKIVGSQTNMSVIFSPQKERTIFNYCDASKKITLSDISKIQSASWRTKAKWFYLAPLINFDFLKKVVNLASQNKIKVFINPHIEILKNKKNELKKILEKTNILLLNKNEFLILLGQKKLEGIEQLFLIREFFKGILIITDGEKEIRVLGTDNSVYTLIPPNVEVKDSTGAGDALGSGFLAGFIKTKNTGQALKLGLKNSLDCVQKIGAHNFII